MSFPLDSTLKVSLIVFAALGAAAVIAPEGFSDHGPFDVILELVGAPNLGEDVRALQTGGRIVVIGSRGAIELEPRLAMRLDASILGMSLPNTPPDELRRAHAAIGAGLENGSLRPLVGREFALADAARAHEAVMDPGAVGKIVLVG